MNVASRVCCERSSVKPFATRTLDVRLLSDAPLRWWPVLYSDDLLLTPHELNEAGLLSGDDECPSFGQSGRPEAA